MVTLANGRVEGGSFWIAPNASITDGELNLIIIKPISKWLIPPLLPLFLFKRSEWIPHVEASKTDELTLCISEPQNIHADGENIKAYRDEFYIHMVPNGLKVICNI